MKRKVLSLTLATIVASTFALTACNSGSADAGTTPEPASADNGSTTEPEPETVEMGTRVPTDIEGVSEIIFRDPTKANPAATRANSENTLVIGQTTETTQKFMPGYSSSTYDSMIVELTNVALFDNDDSANVVFNNNTIATGYELSEDKRTYTFTLREDAVFADGSPITAEDFVFTYTSFADPSYDGRGYSGANDLVGYEAYKDGDAETLEGVVAVDEHTVAFTFNEAGPSNIWNLGYAPLSKAHYGFEKGNADSLKQQMTDLDLLGSGPYKFVRVEATQFLELTRNENYFGDTPEIENIIVKFLADETKFEELAAGNIDILAAVPPNDDSTDRLTDIGIANVRTFIENSYRFSAFNFENEKFQDPRVRQALTYGFDRQLLIDTYYDGYGTVVNSPISTASWAYSEPKNLYEYDPEKAGQLLDEAGWVLNANGIREKDGQELSIEWTTAQSPLNDTMIPILDDNYKKIGIKFVPNVIEFSTLVENMFTNHDFEMGSLGWSLTVDPSSLESTLGSEYNVPGSNNAGSYNNPEFDEAIKLAKNEFDRDKAIEYYAQVTDIVNEDLPYIFISASEGWTAVNTRVQGHETSPFVKLQQVVTGMSLDNTK